MFLPPSQVLSIWKFPSAQVPWIGNYKIDKTGDGGKNIFSWSLKMKNDKTKNVLSKKQYILIFVFPIVGDGVVGFCWAEGINVEDTRSSRESGHIQ